MQAKHPPLDSTRERILEAAGEVFGARGFAGATVRSICARAGVNPALVAYYFKSKDGLYDAVVRHSAYATGAKELPAEARLAEGLASEQRLRFYVHGFMERLLDPRRPEWHRALMAREMLEPAELFERLVRTEFIPHFEVLKDIVRSLLGPRATAEHVQMCAASVIGQILFFQHSRPIIVRAVPGVVYSQEQIRTWAEHVYRFSLAALQAKPLNAVRFPRPHAQKKGAVR